MISVKITRYSIGIYQITNLKNGNFYIGSSVNLYNRFHTHCTKLKKQLHSNKYLQNAYNKYGNNAFLFQVLEYCDKKVLQQREQYYIDLLKPKYNHRKLAHINLGLSPNKKTREKISNTLKKKYNEGLSPYRQEHNWRPIKVYDLEGVFIKEYLCIMDACRELNLQKANLRRALNNKGRAGKYQFRDSSDATPGKYLPNINQYG